MRSVNVLWKKGQGSLSQAYSKGLRMALASAPTEEGALVQVHHWVLCKDYFHDIVWAAHNNKPYKAYGLMYDPKSDPLPSLARLRLLLAVPKDDRLAKEFPQRCADAVGLVNLFEQRIKLPPTKLLRCNDPEVYKDAGVFLAEASGRWAIAPPALSAFVTLLRFGLFNHRSGQTLEQTLDSKMPEELTQASASSYRTDFDLIKRARPALNLILKEGSLQSTFGKDVRKNYPDEPGIQNSDQWHSYAGICNYREMASCGRYGFPKHWKTA